MRHKLVRIVTLSSAVPALVLATVSPALASAETAPVTASSADPYSGCPTTGQTGTVFPDAEVEPQVAVNPHTAGNVIGAWQQDRWSNGGSRGLVAGFSTDGGKTWGQSQLPFSGCVTGINPVLDPFTGAPYDRASDPWVSIGPDGTAYAVGLLATESTISGGGNNDTGVAAATSTDGGQTWGNARLIKADQGTSPVFEATQFFNDKESVTADPTTAGTAYVVWDRLKAPSHTPDAALRAHAFRGPTWFSKTTDGGETWTGTRAIFDPGQNSQTIGNVIVVNPATGVLYDFFEQFSTTGSPHFTPRGVSVGFVSSSDGGATWSGATTIAAQQFVTDTDPNTGAPLRTGEGLPSVAIDPSTGQLYVVWSDNRFTGTVNQIVLTTSTDGGKTWTAPAVISTVTGAPAFTPTVAVNSAGVVGVTYYDLRNLPPGDTTTLPTDYWFTASFDRGATFGDETHVAGSFDLMTAPNAGGFFLGDYEGLGVSGSAFLPCFVQAQPASATGPTDVFANSVTP
ncbi:sialidase family protein [Actinocrinis sp.]|uniref:sialidase family protein n=1 Tax=Actinocrinis sp. TaxID=1920516 RepID=UPI002D78BF9C|nr:sialidase family protein [Actinocrinis sp.]